MGSDDLFKKNAALKRLIKNKIVRDRILIICEGQETEKNYFESFRLPNVKVLGCGRNTNSLIEFAIKEKRKDAYEQVWCVFDRDSFPAQNFNEAFFKAESEKINIAYSNEAFELWYLLHFNYYETAFSRDRYEELLSSLLGFKYQKNSRKIYESIKGLQTDAIRNADRLMRKYNPCNPERDNPSTTVHKLVMLLNSSRQFEA
jgi:hypothetical protein